MIIEIPQNMKLKQEETSQMSSNGQQYICKQVFENAYKRITNWYNEAGMITKQKVQEI